VYFTWRQLLLLIILLFPALAGGFISLDAGNCWALILLFIAIAGGFHFTRMLAIAGPLFYYSWHLLGGSFHWMLAIAGPLFYYSWHLLGASFQWDAGNCQIWVAILFMEPAN
jgi:hypothetical protein